ncbi:cytoplasmic dynein 2 intermediate chain 1 [Ischnura elegans]|uniref:cytoplasmic dynein 2 intermediate chain 1 n=1 Tax=Ischnura elegans TaxID=197161 RepID=UPI001ED89554|nr:cytoplasmic dynein 2 intermediate chain 1 [Ischnura elegans]
MQRDVPEKEKQSTSKVAAQNKSNLKPTGAANTSSSKRDSSVMRKGSGAQTKSSNSSKLTSSSSSRVSKTGLNNKEIEKKLSSEVGILSEKQPTSSSSSKSVPKPVGAKDVVSRRSSAIKESDIATKKKLLDKTAALSSKTGVSSVGKSNNLYPVRTVDKRDQNVKFKGGGPSSSPRNPTTSRSNPRPIDTSKTSARKDSGVRNLGLGVKVKEVQNVKKRVEVVEKDSGKKKVSPLQAAVSKRETNEKPGSRMKENLRRIMSEHVKKGKVEDPSHLEKRATGRPVSVKPSENVNNSEESGNKRGRERTRTWTISPEGESANDFLNYGSNSDLKRTSAMSGSSKHRGGGDGPNVEGAMKTSLKDVVGNVKKSSDSKTSIASDMSARKSVDLSRHKMIPDESGVAAEEAADVDSVTDEYEYEDDFEDYESDFEEYTEDDDDDEGSEVSSDSSDRSSSEGEHSQEKEIKSATEGVTAQNAKSVATVVEGASAVKEDEEDCERKMDSGLYDSGKKKRPEDDVSPLKLTRVDADEGFDEREEVASESDKIKGTIGKEIIKLPSSWSNHAVFFTKKSPPGKEAMKTALKRGQKLLQMITLDEISYSLFDLPPIPYDAYMKFRGHRNSKQVSTQTNEDSHSEGIQTDVILMADAWTQKPPVISLSNKTISKSHPQLLDNSSWLRLGRFMESAGEVMSILLEEQWSKSQTLLPEGSAESSPLSKISFKLGQSVSSDSSWNALFCVRPVVSVSFCKARSNLLLCCHGPPENDLEVKRALPGESDGNDAEGGLHSSLLSVWSVSEPSCPYRLLCCQGAVTKSCFQDGVNKFGQILLAGCEDGSICLWDMYERGGSHIEIPILGRGSAKTRCPMFTTHGDESHLGRIVGLEPILGIEFGDVDQDKMHSNLAKITNQVCSLDEWGVIIVWSIIRRAGSKNVGRFSIVPSMRVCIGETSWNKSESMAFNSSENTLRGRATDEENNVSLWNALAVDSDWILAASDSGSVVCLPVDGDQKAMKVYPGTKDLPASAECIAVNPQGLPFFMVGNFVGQVHLYSHSSKRHFGTWEPPPSSLPSAIVKLAWSPQRPFVFFTVDSLSRIHIWDLASSDIFPLASLPSPKSGQVTDISLSFPKGNSPAYMAIGMSDGDVILHLLREELTSNDEEVRRKELSQFIKYANLL